MAGAQNEKVHFGKRGRVMYGLFGAAKATPARVTKGDSRDEEESPARADTRRDGSPRADTDAARAASVFTTATGNGVFAVRS